jgi:conjugal transfer ATP-binding protein TraC
MAFFQKVVGAFSNLSGSDPSASNEFDSKLFDSGSFERAWRQSLSGLRIQDFVVADRFDESTGLFFQDQTAGFVLEAPPLVGASEETYGALTPLLQSILPVGTTIQMLLWASPLIEPFIDQWSANKTDRIPEALSFLRQKRALFLKELVRGHSDHFPVTLRTFRSILSFLLPWDASNPQATQRILSVKEKVKSTLSLVMGPVSEWEASDLLTFQGDLLNRRAQTIASSPRIWNPWDSLQSQISDPDSVLSVEETHLVLNDVAVQTFSVTHYPQLWALQGMLDILGDAEREAFQIPCPFWIHYGITIPPQDSLKTKILGKTAYVERQVYSPLGKYLPSLQKEAQELAFVRTRLEEGTRLVQTAMTVGILAPRPLFETASSILQSVFQSQGWTLKENRYLHLPLFLSSLPLQWTPSVVSSFLRTKRLKTTLATEAMNLFPLQGEWQGTPTPALFLMGRRGQAFYWNPFDNDAGNYNVCVVGRSGSGKSVFMQELLTATLSLGGRVFVLDVGRSFEKTCGLLSGQFIEFSPKIPMSLNPFTTIPDDPEEAQAALSLIKNTVCLMASPSGVLDDRGAALIERALLQAWEEKRKEASITEVARKLEETGDARCLELAQMLFPYTSSGTYGRFFQGPCSVNLANPFVVVELEELKERKDLQAVVVQMMIIAITSQMVLKRGTLPFHILFDEAWDLMKHPQTGQFIETLARRLRKYQGSLVVGTQSVHDFYTIPGAQAAFENSDWMVLLSQKKESVDLLKSTKRLAMTVAMESQIKSLKTRQGLYAEVLISGPQGYAIGKLVLDPESSLLYSTKSEDYRMMKDLMNSGLGVGEALAHCLQRKRHAA